MKLITFSKMTLFLFVMLFQLGAYAQIDKEAQARILFEQLKSDIVALELRLPQDNFYQNLESYLQIKVGTTDAIKLFDIIFINENANWNDSPGKREFTSKTIGIFIRIGGESIVSHIQEKKIKSTFYLDYNSEALKNALFWSENKSQSQLIQRYLSEVIDLNNNQMSTEKGRYEAYGYQYNKPTTDRWALKTQTWVNGTYYYNPKISKDSAPENKNIQLIDTILSEASANGKSQVVLDLAKVVFTQFPDYSNAFIDIFDQYFNKNATMYAQILSVLKANPLVFSHLDPFKKSLSTRLSQQDKINWIFAFLKGAKLNKWKDRTNINVQNSILELLDRMPNLDQEKYRSSLESLITEKILELTPLEVSAKYFETSRLRAQVSLLIRKVLERAAKGNEEDKGFFKDLLSKDEDRAKYFKGLFSNADKLNTVEYPKVHFSRIGMRLLTNLLVSPSREVINFPANDAYKSEVVFENMKRAVQNADGDLT